MNNQSQLIELVRLAVKRRALSRKTENAYLNHIRRFLEYHGDSDLSVKRADKISRFLKHLEKNCAASTRNQAHSALLFFYREVLNQKLSKRFDKIRRIRRKVAAHEFFTHTEAKAVLANLHGASFLVAALMYGAGLRISEAIALRVRDIDFVQKEIKLREPRTGAIDRTTVLPASLEKHLRRQLAQVKYLHEDDCFSGYGKTFLPASLAQKYPQAADELAWQYLFPAIKLTSEPDAKSFMRLHLSESTVQKAVAEAVEKAQIVKYSRCQTLRYSFALRLFERHCDVHTISRLLGHKTLKTTLNYFEVDGKSVVRSPLD